MTRFTRTAPALLALALLALAGCSTAAPEAAPTAEPTASASCDVSVVVDFGPLDESSLASCADAGAATDVLAQSGITTEGTADYGDQVVCRVNGEPAADETVTIDGQAPFTESCATLNAVAYWAVWVKNTPDGEWEYAQEGVNTLELAEGQSLGLVYTPGTESIPPQG